MDFYHTTQLIQNFLQSPESYLHAHPANDLLRLALQLLLKQDRFIQTLQNQIQCPITPTPKPQTVKHTTKRCRECHKPIPPPDAAKFKNRYYHHDCLQLHLWRLNSPHAKNPKPGKAGHAANGRVIRSPKGLA